MLELSQSQLGKLENAESKPFTNLPLDPFLKGSHVNFKTGNVQNGPKSVNIVITNSEYK